MADDYLFELKRIDANDGGDYGCDKENRNDVLSVFFLSMISPFLVCHR